MKIYSNGKDRTLTGSFPARFKLLNNGVEVPFIRTGKGSIRLSGEIPFGELDVEEVIKQKTPQPAKLDAQSIAIINKADFDQIDILNKKLAINQEQMNAHLKALTEQEATLANLETQNAQAIEQVNVGMAEMAGVFGKEIQADRERIKATAQSIAQDIADSSEILNAKIEVHEKAKNPHKITKETIGLDKVENTSDLDKPVSKATQKELDKKADKSDIEDVRKEIKATEKKQERLVKSIDNANLYGGIGGNELPTGGKKGQILSKSSNKTGDYKWIDNPVVNVHNDLSGRDASDAHPISSITGLQSALDEKQPTIDDIDTIRSNALAGKDASDTIATYGDIVTHNVDEFATAAQGALADTAVQPADLATVATTGDYDDLIDKPTIGNATLTIQKNGTTVDTFTANATSDKTINITVPTQPSDIGAATSAQGAKADSALQPNSPITGATKCKITYDSNGLVTAGSDLEANDIPSLTISKISDITATASELNVLDGITASTTELNYLDGVTSSIQTQLNGKQPTGNYVTTDTIQTINQAATKTFNGRVNFVGSGDANAIYLTTDTRIDVYGTSRTVLGFASGTFLINNAAYPLNLRGSGARPSWNGTSSLALTSDIGNATLTIQKNGTAVDTFTANATSDKTINITVPTKTSDLTNDDGFITGITSSDVTTALGYTPYDDSNPDGYITGITSGDVTTALGYTPYNSSNPNGYQANVIETVKVNGTALTPSSKAVDITVPTNNNQLTNGAGYITSSALSGYATETWVGQQGYLTSTALNGYATQQWVGQQGYITGITSSDVTTALGYTPYDASNPNGYTSNTGTVTSVNNVSPVNGNVSLSIPTVNNPTITITQGGVTKGSFTLNQSTGDTIALDAGGGGSVNTFNLFDHKWSDYQLNDQSWLRADTFSWQDGTVYSDAYDHLVDDLSTATQKTDGLVEWTQPVLTASTTSTDLGNVVVTSSSNYSGYDNWKAMNGVKSGTTAASGWGTNNSTSGWWQVKFPYKLLITGLKGYQRYDGTPANANTVGRFYTSSDKTTPIGDEYNNATSTNWNAVTVTGIPASGIITDTIYFEKTGGGNWGGLGELEITARRVVSDYPITYYEAQDGHKICLPDQEATVLNIYNESGVAWYYILDTDNTRFKLPRENPAREELIQVIRAKGNGIVLGLTDGTNNYGLAGSNSAVFGGKTGAYGQNASSGSGSGNWSPTDTKFGITTDSTKSGIISSMTDSTSVYKGKKYLYFYVGQFSQSATEQTAGLNAELFNGKVDLDGNNATFPHIVETYQSGTNWYRLYSDGWIEQGGRVSGNTTVTLLKPMSDTNYTVEVTGTENSLAYSVGINSRSTTSFTIYSYNSRTTDWIVCGY